MGHVGDRIERDGLVAAVVARHVTLAAVDAHVLVDHGHNLVGVVQLTVRSDAIQRHANHALET